MISRKLIFISLCGTLSFASCSIFKQSAETEYDQSWEFDNNPAYNSRQAEPSIAQNSKSKTKKKKDKKESKATPIPDKQVAENKTKTNENSSNNKVSKYAEKWKISIPNTANVKLLQSIDSWIGTPYKYGGRSKSGTDCSGFCLNVYNEVYNIDIERSTVEILNQSKVVKKAELQEGDFVFFKIKSSRVNHVGIYIANGYFAHASSSRGVMISSLNEEYWTKYWHAGGRILNKSKLSASSSSN
ncbi:MAG TPA: C40 family peptidase [Bacteroidia bacterium]